MIKIFFLIFLCANGAQALKFKGDFFKYTARHCQDLKRYREYLKNAKKGVLEKHPKCNAAAIKTAYKSDATQRKWIDEIEGPYQAYFGHPSSIFRDCDGCISKAPSYKIPIKTERDSKKYVFVLSVDGGGVKGLVPAKILEHIERQTGRRISDIFDIFVGTSTGGLIALFLNTPTEKGEAAYDATDLVRMYKELSSTIFSHPNFLRKLRGTKGILTSKYSAKQYEQLLKQYFRDFVMQQALNPVLITAVDINRRTPFIFSTERAVMGRQQNFFMWEAARATSAAPTFFKPYTIQTRQGKVTLVDGGVGVNNPSSLAIPLAKKLYPNAKILLVSLSTKVFEERDKFRSTGSFGGGSLSSTNKGANAGTLVSNLLDAPSNAAESTVQELLEADGGVYIRIEAEPGMRDIQMDDGSKKALDQLEKIAQHTIAHNKALRRLLSLLPSYIQLKEKDRNKKGNVSKTVDFFEGRSQVDLSMRRRRIN